MNGREGTPSGNRDWLRAAALFGVAFGLSVVPPSLLVSVALIALLVCFPTPRMAAVVAGFLAALIALGGLPDEGLWYAERGWAILLGGWFAALTLRWPGVPFFPRAAASVVGSVAVVAALLRVRPGSWQVLEWLVAERMRSGVSAALEAMLLVGGEERLSPALLETFQRTVELQAEVFPALLALSSLASLGVAWWLFGRLTSDPGETLGRTAHFRFNDHLVWILILGLVLLILGWGNELGRAGSNAVVFMGALYALRGLAVILFVAGGLSFLGATLLLMAVVFVAPVVLALTLCLGLGDTWLDLRARMKDAR